MISKSYMVQFFTQSNVGQNVMDARYYRDVELLERSHVVVAEVTQPSLGVGYELGR